MSDIINIPVQPFDQAGQDYHQVSFVACGGKHTLALAANNQVYAWGNNQYGQLGLGLDEFESFHTPREVCFFREKIVSWLGAGSYHSLALNIEGYGYVWGRNDRGQLGQGDVLPVKSDTKQPCPRIVEQVLGVGIAQACCKYNQTFLCCADKLKNVPDSDVFNVWKSKLKKHEERAQVSASQEYRNLKREMARRMLKISKEREDMSTTKTSMGQQ